jgi:hypothetical protein
MALRLTPPLVAPQASRFIASAFKALPLQSAAALFEALRQLDHAYFLGTSFTSMLETNAGGGELRVPHVDVYLAQVDGIVFFNCAYPADFFEDFAAANKAGFVGAFAACDGDVVAAEEQLMLAERAKLGSELAVREALNSARMRAERAKLESELAVREALISASSVATGTATAAYSEAVEALAGAKRGYEEAAAARDKAALKLMWAEYCFFFQQGSPTHDLPLPFGYPSSLQPGFNGGEPFSPRGTSPLTPTPRTRENYPHPPAAPSTVAPPHNPHYPTPRRV